MFVEELFDMVWVKTTLPNSRAVTEQPRIVTALLFGVNLQPLSGRFIGTCSSCPRSNTSHPK